MEATLEALEEQCASAPSRFPLPASQRPLDVPAVLATVANSVFALGVMGVFAPMKRSATDPASSSRKRHLGTLDAAAAVRLPLRTAAP